MGGQRARRVSARIIAAAVVSVTVLAVGREAAAAPLFWDPISPEAAPAIGGNGTWSTGDSNWRTALSGGAQAVWADGGTAYFGEILGIESLVVDLGSPIEAASITFTSDRYTINGNGFGISLGADAFIQASANATIAAPIASSTGLTKRGLESLTLSAGNTYIGRTHVLGGALKIATGNAGGNLGFTSDVFLETAAVLAVSNPADTAITVPVAGQGRITKNGAGVLTLSGTSTYTGGTAITAGEVKFASNANLGDAAGLIALGDSTNKGTLSFEGTTASMARAITLASGGGEIRSALAGSSLSLSGAITGTGRLTASGAGKVTIASAMSHSGGLTKNGTGTLTLSGANTYTGSTLVSQGTLVVTGSTAAGSTVTVASGATLGGSGSVGCVVNVHGILSPGTSAGGIATLSTGTATWFSDGGFTADILAGGGSDLLVMSNLAQQAGFTITVDSVDSLAGLTAPRIYTWTLAEIGNNTTAFDVGLVNLMLGANLQAHGADIALADVVNGNGNHTLELQYTVVPEPVAFVSLSAIALPLMLRRRRALAS